MQRSLGKLELKKTRIANLNEEELDSVRGGTTPATPVFSAIATSSWGCIGSIAGTVASYSTGQEQSWWNCGGDPHAGNSDKIITNPDGTPACLLPEVIIYGLR